MSWSEAKTSTLTRALVLGGQISLAVLDTTALVLEAKRRHALTGARLTVLGNALTAAGYLCGWLKDKDASMSLSMNGKNGKVYVSGNSELYLRGYVLGCGEGVGEGELSVIRDDWGAPFAGSVFMNGKDMDEDLMTYFTVSEQRPTWAALFTGGEPFHAGGVFFQPLPGASEEEKARAKQEFYECRRLLHEGKHGGIFSRLGAEGVSTRELLFSCLCSQRKAEAIVRSMGREDALSLCRSEGKVTVHCDYCNTDYTFDGEKLDKLFSDR